MADRPKVPVSVTPQLFNGWYRAPELLPCTTKYSTAVDMWAMGCIMGNLLDGQPMFLGDSDLDQAFAKVPPPNLSHPETLDRKYFGHASKRALQFMKV
ncbi:putative CMGC/CDKL protein kinase [Blattamonas nauphoetae]|uniref:CMGC/CDKL protein kinase n=1 Tax=Blattamonas nauphoetae TaxID=2049346 RepID=A0ABQ9YDL2_9EUKA|nr:putative CMGC/CDKL protein kinase [Blattamonas nauphoetae]